MSLCVSASCRQNGVSSSRLRQVREHFFSVDFALDLVLSDLQVLVVCEGRGVAVPAPRYGQRLLAIECACLHYHLQIGVTGDQTLSMDVEVRSGSGGEEILGSQERKGFLCGVFLYLYHWH